MTKSVVFFEVEGGSDKGPDGHRKDTMPMVNALIERGWDAEVIFYADDRREEITADVSERGAAFVSRVNPGSIPGGEAAYFDMLAALADGGVSPQPHPDAMVAFGAKDALAKLTDTPLVPDDTYAYYDIETFRSKFPTTVGLGERVLKQNRGSTGEGIWRVVLVDEREFTPGQPVPLDAQLKCTEAVDNHVETRTLDEFMTFCEQYIVGDNGMLIDMPFLPRIKEGEIRILYVGEKPIFVVHKKPAEGDDAFSATLFSGAKYTYESPEKWAHLVDEFQRYLPEIVSRLGGHAIPLIWTADFILDWDDEGKDRYILGEINCSCVGFTSHLDQGIQDIVAEEIISRIGAR